MCKCVNVRNKFILITVVLYFFCGSCIDKSQKEVDFNKEKVQIEGGIIRCPKGNHTDSILEIIYGMPSEELFLQADSGLVVLGGCIIEENSPNYFCKIHEVSF